ncbi:putative dsdna-dependent atpase [Phaeomoniella chlamydospora]|uniref:Putative dsdna-dependent atpase n=1 Tax=Phaeomoniella chlamydospora TaxID=158046 RepID=A0A0G2GGM1_PHACM|nr:putative dsdna-dependent atpase [Phaeomoniella chlamydospora]
MINKPFRPPSFRKPATDLQSTTPAPVSKPSETHKQRQAKRRRLTDDEDVPAQDQRIQGSTSIGSSSGSIGLRRPLVTVRNPPSPEAPAPREPETKAVDESPQLHAAYYQVLWRKPTTKKHKTWDGDATLIIRNGTAILRDTSSGKEMGRAALDRPLLAGSTLSMAGREIEVDEVLKERPTFGEKEQEKDVVVPRVAGFKAPVPKPTQSVSRPTTAVPGNSLQQAIDRQREERKKRANMQTTSNSTFQTTFKNPLKDISHLPQIPKGPEPTPRHDPTAPGALIMKRPNKVPEGKRLVDVVVDPLLSKHLREHQREGVKFLYECVMGLRDFDGDGAILADEMGLGKTLQTITLIWTLLKQNPIYESAPVIKKALIVCPVTLINNWRKEFRKWLGNERIGVFVADGKKTRLTDFTMGKSYSVMIIGYERLRQVAEDLTKGAGVDIVVADEGHRLKTIQSKSAQAIQSLNTSKRVILSGTPIQNDLSEFFSMVNFVNDGVLGSYKQFVKQFENPIVRSRQPNALEEHIEEGQECSEELARLTTPFILRRTADILSKYLPPKTEYVLFCEPLPAQAYVYRNVLASPLFQSIGTSENALQLITILKKLCNSPFLLNPRNAQDTDSGTPSKILNDLVETLPPQLHKSLSNQASTKLRILDQLLDTIHKNTHEKVVLVSNYTSTLDLLAGLLTSSGFSFLRLDGSTPASKRQSLVDDFNRSSHQSCFAFLLSAKAGGVGLNLIGASRLVLFDVDWNPATDMQAMARIHREGQKRRCHIYRFVLKGSVEERIWQRQVTKIGLADSVMDMGVGGTGKGTNTVAQFSREELKDLFRLDVSEGLRTHDLLGCNCGGHGKTKTLPEIPEDDDYIDIDTLDNMTGTETPTIELKDESSNPISEDEDEDDVMPLPKLIKASKLDMTKQEKQILSGAHALQTTHSTRKTKEEAIQKASLMLYHHINVDKLTKEEEENHNNIKEIPNNDNDDNDDDIDDIIIDDPILRKVLSSEGNRIKWVFRKGNQGFKKMMVK